MNLPYTIFIVETICFGRCFGPCASYGSCSRGRIPSMYAAYKNIAQEDILERPTYTVFYNIILYCYGSSWRWQHSAPESSLWIPGSFRFFFCDASSLATHSTSHKCMVPEQFEKRPSLLSAMYIFTIITMILCMAEIFEILCRRLGYLTHQWQSPAWK